MCELMSRAARVGDHGSGCRRGFREAARAQAKERDVIKSRHKS